MATAYRYKRPSVLSFLFQIFILGPITGGIWYLWMIFKYIHRDDRR